MKTTRIKPVRRKVKHLDWIMAWLVRVTPCAICGESLKESYNPRDPGKSITLHHTEGNREVDEWENVEYVKKMVICHKTCHRSYHLTKSHFENGKQADTVKLKKMERNIAKAVKHLAKVF